MSYERVVIKTPSNNYYFEKSIVEFGENEITVEGNGITFTVDTNKITGLELEGGD